MSDTQGTIHNMRSLVADKSSDREVIHSETHLKHRIADLLFGDEDEGKLSISVKKEHFDKVIEYIKNGGQIFKSPEIKTDKLKPAENTAISLVPHKSSPMADDVLHALRTDIPDLIEKL